MTNFNKSSNGVFVVGVNNAASRDDVFMVGGSNTALHLAALCGRVETVELLIKLGAGVDIKNSLGQTPIHLAAVCGHANVINTLVSKKADVNAQDIDGNSPLHLASMSINCSSLCSTLSGETQNEITE